MADGTADEPRFRGRPEAVAVDRSRSSPNHGVRTGAADRPECIVLHYTGMKDGPSAVDWLCNPASQVSCHYVVDEQGRVLGIVPEDRRAWHAGRSVWDGIADLNSASIGIEIVNGGHDFGLPPFPERQIRAVVALCRDIVHRNGIRPERILAHSDIAPGRKRDPGERFPWIDLAAAGIGHWVDPSPDSPGRALGPGDAGPEIADLQRDLARYGYGVAATAEYDSETETVVSAFQRHFRPARVDGRADPGTRHTLARLLDSLKIGGSS